MLTKEVAVTRLKQATLEGREPITAIQKVFESFLVEYSVEDIQEKETLLNGLLYFANELFKPGKPYGYQEFDLVLSRACPSSETLRFIEEQDGKNIWS